MSAPAQELSLHPLGEFKGGWFVGDFSPTLFPAQAVEIAVKYYKAGDFEAAHVHRVATEFTVITSGRVRMNGIEIGPGTVVRVPPGCATDFSALTDVCTAVVKLPCVRGDKFPAPQSHA